jgi:protein ImuA
MQFVSCHNGQIFTTQQWQGAAGGAGRGFATGLAAIDELLPQRRLARGVIHEILAMPSHPTPRLFALLLAKAATGATAPLVWCDPLQTLFPPAIAAAGIPLKNVYLLNPRNAAEQSWAVAECMRCRGVGATIAPVSRLTRLEARRLQLAAEKGGGIGLLLRPMNAGASVYAAATRWLVAPAQGERTIQRWTVQLIHAHGGRVGTTVILEHHRETNTLRASEQLADRPRVATPSVA